MEALLELNPRYAGADTVEADIEFDDPDSLHDISACPVSCVCSGSSEHCLVTGWSRFME
ncbi:hypothetical protein NDR87_16190 [Nocardia sp. CDC159]|uniref:Uncharacterized protein n=1 Tax=Nocardia pulmonis TaxID=2951408 RepID=A0A9X2EBJ7_9NOCA|nr:MULTISPECIES: hypothetical protein [Nocardia]MCM6775366.1 hypothetical protein [Nocardia pulmonis]MCM6787900.1 hypothetical protein [Nocardia sp. CDC159]